jgi:DNA-binding PadR family transcriptional regulator
MAAKNTSMPKPERKAVILGYLAENDVLLPTGLVHTNLLEYRQITFSEKTTKRMLYEMRDDGLVEVVDRGGFDLYRITEDGRDWLREHNRD